MVENDLSIIDQNYRRGAKLETSNKLFDHIPARLVLYLLSFSSFIVSSMQRVSINFTMLAMVAESRQESNITRPYCYVDGMDEDVLRVTDYGGTLNWSAKEQSFVLSAFYWTFVPSQLIGGVLTQYFGSKRVNGFSHLFIALCSFAIPWAAYTHYILVCILKGLQGFATPGLWASMFGLIGRWIPMSERSLFMTSFQGFSLGNGIAYVLCGFVISRFGWEMVFYTIGSVGVFWCIIWYIFAFDSPETHPRIHLDELKYIKENRVKTNHLLRSRKIPWMNILECPHVWAITLTMFGRVWIIFTLLIHGPKYMKTILGFSVEKNGLLSGLPYLSATLGSVLFCYIADLLRTKQIVRLITIRKSMTALSQVVPGILILVLSFLSCDTTLILCLWFTAITLTTAAYAGAMANIVDIAPNFAAIIVTLAQSVFLTASIIAPMIASKILNQREYSLSAWRTIFWLLAFLAIAAYGFYQIWASAEIQPWNEVTDTVDKLQEEGLVSNKTNGNDTVTHNLTLLIINN